MKFHCVALFLLTWSKTTLQRSNYDSPTYMAAVVEYSPITESANEENVGILNAENYLKIIDKAVSYAIDIIVFPESSIAVPPRKNATFARSHLASYIPDAADNIIPCTDKSKRYKNTLISMSCAARKYKIYMMVNHREIVDCTGNDCGADGFLVYNTNVAFDRNGQVIAKYRKYHLFNEFELNRTEPISTTFTTDFGVTFGTFICYDIFFALPSLNMTRLLGITDILYSSHWYDTSPFLFATEMQAAFAYATDVNLMASGYSFPNTDSGGSGIYLGKQGYVDVVSEQKRTNVLMVAEIPKVINGKRTRNLDRSKVHIHEFTKEEISTSQTVLQDDSYMVSPLIQCHPMELIEPTNKTQTHTVCDRGLCCDFQVTVDFDRSNITKDSNYYRYRFAANNNNFKLPLIDWSGFKACAILACTDDEKKSCGKVFHDSQSIVTPMTFTSLKIWTPEIANEDIFVFPLAYSLKFHPINATDFTFTSSKFGNVSTYQMELKKPVNDILGIAILVRNSEEDRAINSKSVI